MAKRDAQKNVIFGEKKVESQRELMFFVYFLCDDFVFLFFLLPGRTETAEGQKIPSLIYDHYQSQCV